MKSSIKNQIPDSDSANQEYNWTPFVVDDFLKAGDKDLIWKKYCGFLELSLNEFVTIQKMLMKEQIGLAKTSKVGKQILGLNQTGNIDEFRHYTPITDYSYYQACFKNKSSTGLGEPAVFWIEKINKDSSPKTLPFNIRYITGLTDDAVSALILSSACSRGDVRLGIHSKMWIDLQDEIMTGALNLALKQRLECLNLVDTQGCHSENTRDIINPIKRGLNQGLDYIISTPKLIGDIGENIGNLAESEQLSYRLTPLAWCRLLKAMLLKKIKSRNILARDVWKPKGIVCCGAHFSENCQRISQSWGIKPFEVLCSPESGFMAMQNWNRKYLTFIPYRNFYEFIPLLELREASSIDLYQTPTVLMDEVKIDALYELVVTNFHGGPFLRYRTGDFLKVEALVDTECGINLPQFSVIARPD